MYNYILDDEKKRSNLNNIHFVKTCPKLKLEQCICNTHFCIPPNESTIIECYLLSAFNLHCLFSGFHKALTRGSL